MITFFKKFFLSPVIWILLASVLFMSPMLLYPTFNYIDDGQTLLTGKTLLATNDWSIWQKSLFEYENGRLRPAYQLYLLLMYLLFDVRPLGYWLSQTLVLALTLLGLRALIKQLTQAKEWVIGLALTIFLLLPATIENLYRLGTAEPRQTLFLVWFLVWLSKLNLKRFNWQSLALGNILLLLALATKETSVLVWPMIAIFFVWQWWQRSLKIKAVWPYGVSLLGLPLLFLFLLPSGQGYTASVDFSFSKLWYGVLVTRFNWAEYYFPMVVALIALLLRIIYSLKRGKLVVFLKTLQWPFMLLTGFVGSLFFVFSWEHQLERYHYLTFVFMLLFLFVEGSHYRFSQKTVKYFNQKIPTVYAIAFIILVMAAGFFMFRARYLLRKNLIERTVLGFQLMFYPHQSAGSLTHYLYDSLPEGTQVYVDSDDYETVVGLGYFITRLGERSAWVYSGNKDAAINYSPVHRYSTDVFADYRQAPAPRLLVVADRHRVYFKKHELQLLAPKFIHDAHQYVYWYWRVKADF